MNVVISEPVSDFLVRTLKRNKGDKFVILQVVSITAREYRNLKGDNPDMNGGICDFLPRDRAPKKRRSPDEIVDDDGT